MARPQEKNVRMDKTLVLTSGVNRSTRKTKGSLWYRLNGNRQRRERVAALRCISEQANETRGLHSTYVYANSMSEKPAQENMMQNFIMVIGSVAFIQ